MKKLSRKWTIIILTLIVFATAFSGLYIIYGFINEDYEPWINTIRFIWFPSMLILTPLLFYCIWQRKKNEAKNNTDYRNDYYR